MRYSANLCLLPRITTQNRVVLHCTHRLRKDCCVRSFCRQLCLHMAPSPQIRDRIRSLFAAEISARPVGRRWRNDYKVEWTAARGRRCRRLLFFSSTQFGSWLQTLTQFASSTSFVGSSVCVRACGVSQASSGRLMDGRRNDDHIISLPACRRRLQQLRVYRTRLEMKIKKINSSILPQTPSLCIVGRFSIRYSLKPQTRSIPNTLPFSLLFAKHNIPLHLIYNNAYIMWKSYSTVCTCTVSCMCFGIHVWEIK